MGSMRTTTHLLTPVLILTLAFTAVAVPATAFAQSAGDDQYVDPFQEPGGGGDNGAGGGGGGDDTSGGNGEVAPTESTPSTAAQTDSGGGLPTTGLAIGVVALTGALLLGGGTALRRRWRPRS
jgi:hypothetical protein